MGIPEEKNNAIVQLKELEKDKISLLRDVFFVPGVTSESCAAWLSPYTKENLSMKEWADRILINWQDKVHYITFTEEESKESRSFLDFAKILSEKIKPYLKNKNKVDLVGHSMGGLDISAAIINNYLLPSQIKNVVTLGSPFHGAEWGQLVKDMGVISWIAPGAWGLLRFTMKLMGYSYYHILQLESMNPKGKMIIDFDSIQNRTKLLENVEKLYTFVGTDDNTVKDSAFFNGYAVNKQLLDLKLNPICFEGATHSGVYGLPQDPRVVLKLFQILKD